MKLLRKVLTSIGITISIVTMMISYSYKVLYAQVENEKQNIVKVAVLLYRFDDAYISLVRQGLEEIQKKNEDKVEFKFYDGKNDQVVQNKTLDTLLENKSVDLLLLNLVDMKRGYEVINKIKNHNIPVVLFDREPLDINSIKSYSKAYYVGTEGKQAGILQGKALVDAWHKNKADIDINKNNIMEYVMLVGVRDSKDSIQETKYSISTINDAGIQTQALAQLVCDWNRELAKQAFEPVFLSKGNKIEVIISNNDEMAIGAIEILQKYGYNKGSNERTIPVFGIDAIPAAQELIKKGVMTGTVFQDSIAMAEACYDIGMNLVNHKSPLKGTQYTFDDTMVAVRIPYEEYKP